METGLPCQGCGTAWGPVFAGHAGNGAVARGPYTTENRLHHQKDPVSDIDCHSCITSCTGWSPTPRADWEQLAKDCCSACQGHRLKHVLGKLVPVRRNTDSTCNPHSCMLALPHLQQLLCVLPLCDKCMSGDCVQPSSADACR